MAVVGEGEEEGEGKEGNGVHAIFDFDYIIQRQIQYKGEKYNIRINAISKAMQEINLCAFLEVFVIRSGSVNV